LKRILRASPTFLLFAALFAITLPAPASADDFDDCARLEGNAGIDACTRGINSGRFSARDLGTLYYNRGILQDSNELKIQDYTQAIRARPDYASAYYNRGLIYRKMNRLDDALADYTTALRFEQKHDIYNNRGVAYEKKGDIDKALADYSAALRLKSDYALAHFNRGNIYSDQGKTDLALQDYDNAIRFDPKYADAFFNRGLLLKKMGRRELAIGDFRAVLRIDPGDNDAVKQLEQLGEKP